MPIALLTTLVLFSPSDVADLSPSETASAIARYTSHLANCLPSVAVEVIRGETSPVELAKLSVDIIVMSETRMEYWLFQTAHLRLATYEWTGK
jgi:hypothetical protein